MAEPDQFALHPPVSPGGFSAAMRMRSLVIAVAVGGRAVPGVCGVVPLAPTSRRCQARIVAGVTERTSAQRRRGTRRDRAASHTRSAGVSCTRATCRRSTAFSCRKTNSSASLLKSRRTSTAIRPSRQRTSRYKIDSNSIRRSLIPRQHAKSAGQGTASSFRAPQGVAIACRPGPRRPDRSPAADRHPPQRARAGPPAVAARAVQAAPTGEAGWRSDHGWVVPGRPSLRTSRT
jgi:hypothetical protein